MNSDPHSASRPVRLDQLQKQAREVRTAYQALNAAEGRPAWSVDQYVCGLMGDVGDLAKLVTATQGYREAGDVRAKLRHELSDCLWSILTLAEELDVDLAEAYQETMSQLLTQIAMSRSAK